MNLLGMHETPCRGLLAAVALAPLLSKPSGDASVSGLMTLLALRRAALGASTPLAFPQPAVVTGSQPRSRDWFPQPAVVTGSPPRSRDWFAQPAVVTGSPPRSRDWFPQPAVASSSPPCSRDWFPQSAIVTISPRCSRDCFPTLQL